MTSGGLAGALGASFRQKLGIVAAIALFATLGSIWAFQRTMATVFPPTVGVGLGLVVGGGVFAALYLELRQQTN